MSTRAMVVMVVVVVMTRVVVVVVSVLEERGGSWGEQVSACARVWVAVGAIAVSVPDRKRGHQSSLVLACCDGMCGFVESNVAEERVEAEVVNALERSRDQERRAERDAE